MQSAVTTNENPRMRTCSAAGGLAVLRFAVPVDATSPDDHNEVGSARNAVGMRYNLSLRGLSDRDSANAP